MKYKNNNEFFKQYSDRDIAIISKYSDPEYEIDDYKRSEDLNLFFQIFQHWSITEIDGCFNKSRVEFDELLTDVMINRFRLNALRRNEL